MNLCMEISKLYKVKTKMIICNLDGPYNAEKVVELEHKFSKLDEVDDITILINNAGLATNGMLGTTDAWNYQSFLSCMYVDTFPIPLVTKFILPKILS